MTENVGGPLMAKAGRPRNTEHPLAMGSFRSWLALMARSRGIDAAYLPRALFVTLTTLLTSPLRLGEKLRYGRRVRRAQIHPSPIFIIGHWRSGTTYLHNLLCQDAALGFVSTFQTMAPGFCLLGEGTIKRGLSRLARARYPTRLIDNIPLDLDAPQEDEFAIANMTTLSFLHGFTLPRQAEAFFARSVLLEGLSERAVARRLRSHETVLRKATIRSSGRRLVLKNCASTGHIKALLRLFPDARFIHIYRNPYHVFLSTLHLHRTVLPRSQLQHSSADSVEQRVLRFYKKLLRAYLRDRSAIPPGRLVEVRFEDLETEPLEQLRRVYEELSLPGFAQAEDRFRSHIASVADYRKNTYTLDEHAIAAVNRHWGFAFEQWGYTRLEPRG